MSRTRHRSKVPGACRLEATCLEGDAPTHDELERTLDSDERIFLAGWSRATHPTIRACHYLEAAAPTEEAALPWARRGCELGGGRRCELEHSMSTRERVRLHREMEASQRRAASSRSD